MGIGGAMILDYNSYVKHFLHIKPVRMRKLPVMTEASVRASAVTDVVARQLKPGDVLYSNFVSFQMEDGSIEPARAVVTGVVRPSSNHRWLFELPIQLLYGEGRECIIDANLSTLWRTRHDKVRDRHAPRAVHTEEAGGSKVVEAVGRIKRTRTGTAVKGRIRPA